jgi:hypothetical protein
MDQRAAKGNALEDLARTSMAETVSVQMHDIPSEKKGDDSFSVTRVEALDSALATPPVFPDGGLRAWLVIAGVCALNFSTCVI